MGQKPIGMVKNITSMYLADKAKCFSHIKVTPNLVHWIPVTSTTFVQAKIAGKCEMPVKTKGFILRLTMTWASQCPGKPWCSQGPSYLVLLIWFMHSFNVSRAIYSQISHRWFHGHNHTIPSLSSAKSHGDSMWCLSRAPCTAQTRRGTIWNHTSCALTLN